jgi:hypothetical protein
MGEEVADEYKELFGNSGPEETTLRDPGVKWSTELK